MADHTLNSNTAGNPASPGWASHRASSSIGEDGNELVLDLRQHQHRQRVLQRDLTQTSPTQPSGKAGRWTSSELREQLTCSIRALQAS
jgi:hypothetical protein